MATSVRSLATYPSRRLSRRSLVVVASLLVSVLFVWQLSSANLAVVAVAIAPVGAMSLLLVRERGTLPAAASGAGSVLDDWEAFRREIDRSRRHERPVALAVASFPDHRLGGPLLADTITLARSQMRSIDLLLYDGSALWLLMPESHRDGAVTAIRRITDTAQATRDAVWRLVIFPDDALTVGSLMAELDRTAPLALAVRPT